MESGTHDELMAKKGHYYKLYTAQLDEVQHSLMKQHKKDYKKGFCQRLKIRGSKPFAVSCSCRFFARVAEATRRRRKIRQSRSSSYFPEKYFSLMISTGISSPVHSLKEAAPWYNSMYIPFPVLHPASFASRSRRVSCGL